MPSPYLSAEHLRRLASYEIAAKLLAEGWLSGKRRSRQRGASTEFHDYRPYAPGDDPGLIDWRVFARTDRPYLKTFEQETNLECHLLVDSSASMGFSGGAEMSKLEYASYFAAALAWLVVKGADRVSLTTFDQRVRNFLAPGSTQRHLLHLLTQLETNKPAGETSLADVLHHAAQQLRRRGTLIVLSDFYTEPAVVFNALNPFIHRGFKIHLFHLLSPEEMELPESMLARFVDSETSQRLIVHTASVRDAYTATLREHIERLRTLSVQRRIDYIAVRTDGSFWQLFDRVAKRK
jgi:uncharacterized protein (DUF58 family)